MNITIELLEQHGESGFRIEELMERTGISKSSLYLRFGSRDGLLAAAYSQIFTTHIMESVTALAAFVRSAQSPAELRAGLHAATAFVSSPDRFGQRLDRAAIIAGIRGRPECQRSLAAAQTELTNTIAQLFEEAERRGLININVKYSARVGAQFIQAVAFGRIIAEIEELPSEELRSEWIALSNELIDRVLFDGLVND